MAKAGSVVADVLLKLKETAQPGITTAALNQVALDMTETAGAQALFKGVRNPYARRPFPGAICASINDQLVHGIPSEKVVLADGDILSVDFGIRLDGYCADAAVTMGIGTVSPHKQRLMDVTRAVLDISIQMAKPGVRWSTIASKMQRYAEKAGYSVVRDFVGHGIGARMHEDPKVPNFVSTELLREDILLKEGMTLAIEPMINEGSYQVKTLPDGWTVVTQDGKCAAHYEHTIAIVKNGCNVLTLK